MPIWYPGAKSEAGGQKSWKCSWLDQVEQTNGWLDQVGETGWEISDCQASELGRYAEGREEVGRKLKFGTRVAQRKSSGGQEFWGWPGVQEPLWERCWRQSCFSAIFLFKALVCSTASKFFASESPCLFSWVRQNSSFSTSLSALSLSTSSLRDECFTLILYKELSSSIFQMWVSQCTMRLPMSIDISEVLKC